MTDLKPNQILAATMLAAGKSCRDTANEIGCTPETISHWKKDASFEALLNQLKWNLLETARDNLQTATLNAAQALQELSQHAKSEETKRKACMNILNLAGLNDPKSGLYGWGIGGTTTREIETERKAQQLKKTLYNGPFKSLLG